VDDELQVYTWPDVTLRELADLIKDVAPEARSNTAKLQFRLIYPDKAGKNVMTELGTSRWAGGRTFLGPPQEIEPIRYL